MCGSGLAISGFEIVTKTIWHKNIEAAGSHTNTHDILFYLFERYGRNGVMGGGEEVGQCLNCSWG